MVARALHSLFTSLRRIFGRQDLEAGSAMASTINRLIGDNHLRIGRDELRGAEKEIPPLHVCSFKVG